MIVGRVMKSEWESMTTDDLFASHEQMVAVLRARLVARKAALERRLRQLNQQSRVLDTGKPDLRPSG